jgi:hypothetical protein
MSEPARLPERESMEYDVVVSAPGRRGCRGDPA